MCELFAFTSNQPATVSVSLDQFASHGSSDSENKDGWGIAYYFEGDIRRYRDTGPAAESVLVKFVEEQSLRSTQVLAHIRNANVGSVRLPNTHPFSRELGGNMHTFAHNGYLGSIATEKSFALHRFQSIGDTDSEHAFCVLLDRLSSIWMHESDVPAFTDRLDIVALFAREIREMGLSNFIYCDGDTIFVHADRRRQSDGKYRPPGLWLHQQTCPECDGPIRGGGISIDSERQKIAMVASVPITEDHWEPLDGGTVIAMRNGEVVAKLES